MRPYIRLAYLVLDSLGSQPGKVTNYVLYRVIRELALTPDEAEAVTELIDSNTTHWQEKFRQQ